MDFLNRGPCTNSAKKLKTDSEKEKGWASVSFRSFLSFRSFRSSFRSHDFPTMSFRPFILLSFLGFLFQGLYADLGKFETKRFVVPKNQYTNQHTNQHTSYYILSQTSGKLTGFYTKSTDVACYEKAKCEKYDPCGTVNENFVWGSNADTSSFMPSGGIPYKDGLCCCVRCDQAENGCNAVIWYRL